MNHHTSSTQQPHTSEGGGDKEGPSQGNRRPTHGHQPTAARRWWQRPWVVPLAFIALAFVAFSLPPYLSFDPSQSRVPPPPGVGWYFPLLAAHVVFASVAMLTCWLQVWPWFRQPYRTAHRIAGRIYVFGGVLPAVAVTFPLGVFAPFGPVAQVSNLLLAVLWLGFTVTGFRHARARRFRDHRVWMLRSFALTMSIVANRVFGLLANLMLEPQLDTTFSGDVDLMINTTVGLGAWLGWIIPLLAVQWWLERPPPRPLRTPIS